jgi:hypothetical protein
MKTFSATTNYSNYSIDSIDGAGGRPKDNTSKDNSSNAVDSLLGSTLRNVACTPLQQLNAFPSSIKRLAKAVSVLDLLSFTVSNISGISMTPITLNITRFTDLLIIIRILPLLTPNDVLLMAY